MTETQTLPLRLDRPLSGVNTGYYKRAFPIVDELGLQAAFADNEEGPDYEMARLVLLNNLYLIHERLNLHAIRDIDYDQVHSFALQNKDLVRYLFRALFEEKYHPTMEVYDNWLQPAMDMLECNLYSPSNRYTKHIFH